MIILHLFIVVTMQLEKSKLNIGPTFLNDLLQLKDRIDKDILEDARKSNCEKEVEFGIQISKYLQGLGYNK